MATVRANFVLGIWGVYRSSVETNSRVKSQGQLTQSAAAQSEALLLEARRAAAASEQQRMLLGHRTRPENAGRRACPLPPAYR